jgi:hypothetical protein
VEADPAYRIVKKSNHDLDWYNEEFADGDVLMSKVLADIRCRELNRGLTASSRDIYVVEPHPYKLYIGIKP